MQLRKALRLAVTFLAITCAGQFPVLGLLVAYGAGTPGSAEISLIDASATLTQTGDTAWTLEKPEASPATRSPGISRPTRHPQRAASSGFKVR